MSADADCHEIRGLTAEVALVRPLAEAPVALGPDAPRVPGRTVIEVTPGW